MFGEGGLRTQNRYKRSSPDKPLLSVVTVVFNGEKHLTQAIESVLRQPYDNIEYIVIDGGSRDNTLNILKRYEGEIDYWVSEPDEGIYDAMNKGVLLATGDIIGLLNSDDWYSPTALYEVEKAYRELSNRSSVLLGNWKVIFEDIGKTLRVTPSLKFHKLRICHQALFIPKRVYMEIGLYNTRYKLSADLDMAVRLYVNGYEYVHIDKFLVNFRTTGASGRNYRETGKEQAKIIRENLAFPNYLNFLLLRLKFETLSCLASIFQRVFGKKFADRLKIIYFQITQSKSLDANP